MSVGSYSHTTRCNRLTDRRSQAVDAAQMKYIKTADDTSLYVKVWGKGKATLDCGVPTLIIHGPHGLFAMEKERLTQDLLSFLAG